MIHDTAYTHIACATKQLKIDFSSKQNTDKIKPTWLGRGGN